MSCRALAPSYALCAARATTVARLADSPDGAPRASGQGHVQRAAELLRAVRAASQPRPRPLGG
eukprot:3328213-Prymnesium_polylepis.1